MNKYILVTGGYGFIGKAVVKILEKNYKVIVVDNLITGTKLGIKKNIFFQENLNNKKFIKNLFKKYNIKIIVHLAAWAGVRLSLDMPNVYTKNNILGTQGVIDIAEQMNIPVVYASSSSVYAGQIPPFTEQMNFKHHLNPYAWSKYVNECQFKHSKVPSSIGFRFFTVYGPYGRPDMALHGFTNSIIKDEPIEVFGHGDMSRDFTYVQDIVNGVQLLIDKVSKINDV